MIQQKEIGVTQKILSGVIAFACVAIGLPAVAADSDLVREVRDRAAIEKLMWNYVRALDTENADAYAALFTPDGQFGAGPTAEKGHDALKKMINGLREQAAQNEAKTGQKRGAMYHVITNSYLEFVDKDHARLQAYWMTVFAGTGQAAPPRVAAAGREVDELVRVDGQWLIQLRDVTPKD